MSADKLVFDLSQEIEGSPQVFIRKDWLSILDNMNQNYSANQTIIDTSQLSNSNKFMNYREGYLAMPLTMVLTGPAYVASVLGATSPVGMLPQSQTGGAGAFLQGTSCDYVMGLKNWFGTVIHSFTLDMNGTTIIQQTPFINMVNSFRLLTSLSYNDIITQGAVIGFYPDDPTSFSVNGFGNATGTVRQGDANGNGVCNNTLFPTGSGFDLAIAEARAFNYGDKNNGNIGLVKRIQYINFDPDSAIGSSATTAVPPVSTATSSGQLLNGGITAVGASQTALNNLWISYISAKSNVGGVGGTPFLVTSVMATIYLKHIHNFFAMIPLLKGTFFKMTAFLNNTSVNFTVANKVVDTTGQSVANPLGNSRAGNLNVTGVSVPVGGVNPLMISSSALGQGGAQALGNGAYLASLSVGARCLNQAQASLINNTTGQCSQSIFLYVPAYTFNPVFESAYLSSPVKSIKYSDYYQYQVQGIAGNGGQFNNLITNGIANIKSVLIIPYYSASSASGAQFSGLPQGLPVYQSPFDTAGSGTTSPLCLFSNFNVVISGQNSIYNTEQRAFEHFNDYVKGCNSVNGDLTDGLTSGLLGWNDYWRSQCFFYTNVGRQLPVEEQVPKSIQIVGTNQSAFALDLFVMVEYGVSVDVDSLTGARV